MISVFAVTFDQFNASLLNNNNNNKNNILTDFKNLNSSITVVIARALLECLYRQVERERQF